MSKPTYIERGGEQSLAQPFMADDVQWFGFGVAADKKSLTELCNKYLNEPLGENNYVPAASHVLFVFNRLGKMYCKNPPDNEMGWYTEDEAAIWMLVFDKKRHNLFWFQPYMIVDDSYAMASGREIYGFPKQMGWIDLPDGPDAPSKMGVRTVVVEKQSSACQSKKELLFEAKLKDLSSGDQPHEDHSSMKDLVKEVAAALDIGANFLADFELDRNLFEDLVHLRIPMVFLKQIRDSVEPDKACYQAVQECDTNMTGFHGARIYFHRYEIDLNDYASHPIRKDLGLSEGPLEVDVAFWAKFDMELNECNVVEPGNGGKSPEKKEKVAILGGGVSAVTTAMQLSQEGWQDRFESITLYQMGWRLGGKGATGRGKNGSIEEHGLHIWLGYYENAFKLIREIYQWARRPQGSPLATWDEAFSKHNYVGTDQQYRGEWHPWMIDFPENDGTPGEGGELPSMLEYVEMTIAWIGKLHRPKTLLGWIKWPFKEIGRSFGFLAKESLHVFTHSCRTDANLVHDHEHHSMLIDMLRGLTNQLEQELAMKSGIGIEARRLLLIMNMGATIALGLLEEKIFSTKDLEKLEGVDFSEWLRKHNALELVWNVQTNPLLRGMYDFAFAYEGGDASKPNFATAPALLTVFRMLLTYKGAIFWKMTAGMGDSIFAPAYQALINRGVEVKFFHKVTNLGLSEDKKSVATIDMDIQATTRKGEAYQPLFPLPVKGGELPCWPKHPLYDQLSQGDKLREGEVNLESFWTTWKGDSTSLEVGKDFDTVVFGISIGSIPYLCKELVDASDKWQDMVENVGTVRTQALQLWLEPDIKSLGWEKQSPILDAWIQPLSTWADMSDLLEKESWGTRPPGSLAYFVGPMEGAIPQPSKTDTPKNELEKAVRVADEMLSGSINTLWTNLGKEGLPESDVRLRYSKANIDPSERYVMSLAGSADYRLKADESGFSNLVLTGDWIRNGYNAGCVEASAWSGIQAANVVLGRPLNEGVIS